MQQVAALTQTPQVAEPVVCRVVIEVGGSQYDAALPHPRPVLGPRWLSASTMAIAPDPPTGVIPAAIRQAIDDFAVAPAAALADAPGAIEPHMPAELHPIDRVERTHLRLNRHRPIPSSVARERFGEGVAD
jgi:hypothetical protein